MTDYRRRLVDSDVGALVFAAVVGGRETHTLPRSLGESVSPQFNVLAARIVLTVAPCIALVALLRSRILRLG